MATADDFRRAALALEGTVEAPHMDRRAFKVARTYATLAALGFQWSSNQVINPMGWRYINRDYDAGEPWTPGLPPHPFRHAAGVLEIPMHSEYTWYLEEGDVERHFQLAKADFERARANGDAFVVLSHYYAMTGQWATGLQVYARLFAYARELGDVRFVTLSQLAEQSNN